MGERASRILARIGNPLEWSRADRCLLVIALTIPVTGIFWIAGRYHTTHPEILDYLDGEFLKWLSTTYWYWGVSGWIVLLVWSLLARRSSPDSPALLYATVQYWSLTNALFAYFVGPYTSPIWVVILASAIYGFILFEMRPMLLGLGTFFAISAAILFAETQGWIRSAPLLLRMPLEDGRISWWWAVIIGGASLSTVALNLLLIAWVVRRWRDREAALERAYADLNKAKDQLVQAESLAAVGSLVTGAAHELRNPLSSSHAIFQSLSEDLRDSPSLAAQEKKEALDAVALALKGQNRAAAIVERLYKLTDDLRLPDEKISWGEAIEDLTRRYPTAVFGIPGNLRARKVPYALMAVVLPQLLDNALAAGGTSPPEVTAREDASGCKIMVSDHGTGIPKDQLPHVFKPFFTGRKAGEGHGVGLGLYIVHELLTRMGGRVTLESDVSLGTRVELSLPRGA